MPFKFSDAQKNALQRFLERRNLKERTIELLGAALASNSLKRGDLTQNQSATYEKLIDDVETAIKKKWLTEDDLITLLDESELAGRQHICVFSIQAKSADAVLSEVLTPDYLTTDLPVLEDFWTVPTTPTARLLRATKTEAVVKIVTDRRYWLREIDLKRSTTEEEWIHRWTERERSAILVKFSKSTNRLQVRIPPKEKASQSES
ncbi:MAG TPA: hypothetical protein VNT79_08370, partial [Phycisphaerae bacterium]|nr:hypothetical protein [Phycisphaerae bacterium]